VCSTASGEARPKETVDDDCRLLDAGINVVTTSVPDLLYPDGCDATDAARLEAAVHLSEPETRSHDGSA
jgi:hypothetical protein